MSSVAVAANRQVGAETIAWDTRVDSGPSTGIGIQRLEKFLAELSTGVQERLYRIVHPADKDEKYPSQRAKYDAIEALLKGTVTAFHMAPGDIERRARQISGSPYRIAQILRYEIGVTEGVRYPSTLPIVEYDGFTSKASTNGKAKAGTNGKPAPSEHVNNREVLREGLKRSQAAGTGEITWEGRLPLMLGRLQHKEITLEQLGADQVTAAINQIAELTGGGDDHLDLLLEAVFHEIPTHAARLRLYRDTLRAQPSMGTARHRVKKKRGKYEPEPKVYPRPNRVLSSEELSGAWKAADGIYRQEGREFWALMYAHSSNPERGHDAVQEMFLKFLEKDGKDGSGAEIKDTRGWMLHVGRNWLRDVARRKSSSLKHSDALDDLPSRKSETPDTKVARDERIALVTAALTRLKEEDREVLVLRYGNGWSSNRIAYVLDTSAAAIDMRLSRARRRLAALIDEFANGPDATV